VPAHFVFNLPRHTVPAFIEKILNLNEDGKYRLVTCGEELHLAYNRVSLS
jgi:hypothetical protein